LIVRPAWAYVLPKAALFFIMALVIAMLFSALAESVAIGIVVMVLTAPICAWGAYWMRQYNVLVITNERLLRVQGCFAVQRAEVYIADIREIRVNRGLLDALIGVGQLRVTTAALGSSETMNIEGIPDSDGIVRVINQYREPEQT